MTQPWLTINICSSCGGDKLEIQKLPVRNFKDHVILLDPCKCNSIEEVLDYEEKE